MAGGIHSWVSRQMGKNFVLYHADWLNEHEWNICAQPSLPLFEQNYHFISLYCTEHFLFRIHKIHKYIRSWAVVVNNEKGFSVSVKNITKNLHRKREPQHCKMLQQCYIYKTSLIGSDDNDMMMVTTIIIAVSISPLKLLLLF